MKNNQIFFGDISVMSGHIVEIGAIEKVLKTNMSKSTNSNYTTEERKDFASDDVKYYYYEVSLSHGGARAFRSEIESDVITHRNNTISLTKD
jgi:hypothetical protein